jgi:hypothetical protein
MLACEAIGSVPRPKELQEALKAGDAVAIQTAQNAALLETLTTLRQISGDNVICDGEQVCYNDSAGQLYYLVCH